MYKVVAKRRKCLLWFPIRFTKYEIVKRNDDYELIINKGLISKNEEKIKLYKINDITYKRSFSQFFFAQGNLIIESSDKSCSGQIVVKKIQRAKSFGEKLDDLVSIERKRVSEFYHETNIMMNKK